VIEYLDVEPRGIEVADRLAGEVLGRSLGIAGGLNLYGYANGDPITFSDPEVRVNASNMPLGVSGGVQRNEDGSIAYVQVRPDLSIPVMAAGLTHEVYHAGTGPGSSTYEEGVRTVGRSVCTPDWEVRGVPTTTTISEPGTPPVHGGDQVAASRSSVDYSTMISREETLRLHGWKVGLTWILVAAGCGEPQVSDPIDMALRDMSEEVGVPISRDQLMLRTEPSRAIDGEYLVVGRNFSEDDPRPILVYHVGVEGPRRITDASSWLGQHGGSQADPRMLCEDAFRLHHWLRGTERSGYLVNESMPLEVRQRLASDGGLDSIAEMETTVRVSSGSGGSTIVSFWAVEVDRVARFDCEVRSGVPELRLVSSLDGLDNR
jgi:hypothetical protein